MSEAPGGGWDDARPIAGPPPLSADWSTLPKPVRHTFTHFELALDVWRADVDEMEAAPTDCWWAPAATLPEEALPSVMKKVIEAAYPGATKRAKGAR